MNDERLLDVYEVANLLGVSKWWVWRNVDEGKFPFVRVGRFLRFRQDDVRKYIEDGFNKPLPENNRNTEGV